MQRVAQTTGPACMRKAVDCVAGPVGAQVSQALAPGGQLVSTRQQTDPAALTIPLQARSVIHETKTVRGSWLNRWFGTASPETVRRTLARVHDLIAGEVLSIPQGRPFPLARFAEAVALAEAPDPGRGAASGPEGATTTSRSHRMKRPPFGRRGTPPARAVRRCRLITRGCKPPLGPHASQVSVQHAARTPRRTSRT